MCGKVREKEVKKKGGKIAVIGASVFIATFVAVFAVLLLVRNKTSDEQDNDELSFSQDSAQEQYVESDELGLIEPEPAKIEKMDFQSLVDDFASGTSGRKGVIIYDLMAGEVSAEYDADVKFAAASLYKLFVVYEGYRKVQNGEWSGDETVGRTGRNVTECLDLAIRESNSECAEALWGMIGRDELDAVVQSEFELPDVEVGALMATPREIMKMMARFYTHQDLINEDLVARMKDSFLNQPVTTYDWRQGLPSGFSDEVMVYNKVGWNYNGSYWDIYNDAAIVDFVQDGRTFVVVVMTSGLSVKSIIQFGERLEAEFKLLLRSTVQKAEL